jgi:PTS system nitrogen regulatory IIA component
LLSVSEKSVYRWISDGDLPAYRVSGQYRFNRAELLAWATARRVNLSPRIFEEDPESATLPDFVQALQMGGIHYRVGGGDKASVLREATNLLRLPDEVDREFLFQVLLARESLASTAVGNGIAIPHVRNPVVHHVTRPTIALCFLETPVEFDALDGQPVRAIFPMVSPTIRAHLHLLSRLSFALRDARFSDLISEIASRDAILSRLRELASHWPVVGQPSREAQSS